MKLHPSKIALLVSGMIAGAVPFALQAQQAPTTTTAMDVKPGKAVAAETTKATATVVGIETGSRTLSLKGPKGRVIEVAAGPEVKNFDQIKVGDTVRVEFVRALSLELKKKGTVVAGASARQAASSAAPGAQPAAAVGASVTVIADVVAVDQKTHMVTLRGPKGNLVDIQVNDPEQLKNVKTGDHVEAVYAEALAVTVEPVSKAKEPAEKKAKEPAEKKAK
jgi:Cu/Ag efflux protein CusF